MEEFIVSGDEDIIGGCRWTTLFGAQWIDLD